MKRAWKRVKADPPEDPKGKLQLMTVGDEVVIDFRVNLSWLALTPDVARGLGAQLIAAADMIDQRMGDEA